MCPFDLKKHVTLLILGTIFVIYFFVYSYASFQTKEKYSPSICTTRGCLKAAESIMKNMNTSHKPCNNFYLFACGNFVKGADVPKGQGYVDSISRMKYELQKKFKDGIEKKVQKNEPRVFKLLRLYYKSCLNSDHTGKVYRNKILNILNEFGGWPILANEFWDESKFDWKNIVLKMRELGLTNAMNSLIRLDVHTFGEKLNESYIRFTDAVTGIDRNYLNEGWNNKEVQKYYNRMVDTAVSLGADKTQAELELKKSLVFEMNLAKISQVERHLYNVGEFNNTGIENLSYEYLYNFLSQNTRVDSVTKLSVDFKSLKSLFNLIANVEKRTIANYLIWRVTKELMDFVNSRITNANNYSSTRARNGDKFWKNCINYVIEKMPLASGAFYIRNYFNQTLRTDILEMTEYLRKSFKEMFSEVSWMDHDGKFLAQKKLESMKVYAAYPDELLDDQKLNSYFTRLSDPVGNFLEDHLALLRFNYESKSKHTVNISDSVNHGSSATVDVVYHDKDNSIDIFAGFLQETFFAPDKPNYLNYGGIGHLIAREMSQAFYKNLSQVDEIGDLINCWDSKIITEYKNRSQCFVNQYSKFRASKRKIPINGEYTLKENIADNNGFKVAYRAYEEWEKEHGKENGLPGLEYTPRQLFWIYAANTACTRFRLKGWDIFLSDKRSPAPFRIIGSFSNIDEFSNDFGCRVGSRMNPKEKCSMW